MKIPIVLTIVVVIIMVLVVVSLLPVFPAKPSWCTFSKLLRDKKVNVRGAGNDTSTLSISNAEFPAMYALFSEKTIGDGRTPNYHKKSYNYKDATEIMKREGLAWQGEGMRKTEYIYLPECSFSSASFPWKECLKAMDIPIPTSTFWVSVQGIQEVPCFPNCDKIDCTCK